MIGYYFRTTEDNISKIQNGSLTVMDLIYTEKNTGYLLDIDTVWHAIHFTLTGTSDKGDENNIFSKLVLCINPVNGEDMGYGPAMLITANEVKHLSEALNLLNETELRMNFSIPAMQESDIYLCSIDVEDNDFFDYIWSSLIKIKNFFNQAASEQQCILFYIQ